MRTQATAVRPELSRQKQFEEIKRCIHGKLVDKLDLSRVGDLEGDVLKREIRIVVEHLCDAEEMLLNRQERDKIVDEVIDEVLGLGPLELILKDHTISDILINGPKKIYVERGGRMEKSTVAVSPSAISSHNSSKRVAEEITKSHPEIGEEFSIANQQLQFARPRAEVLKALGLRSGVDDLKQLSSILIQADKFGSSVATALRVQSDAMRVKRRQIAEEKAAKTAVKMIFPLVLFIFPGIFVVLVSPAAITMYRSMLQ